MAVRISGPTGNCATRAHGTRVPWSPRASPPGDRVLFAAPSVPEFVVAYLGIQAAGCVVVPVNTMATRAEVEYSSGPSTVPLSPATPRWAT
ncbi:AMP-binding protein [Streptomyces sp. NPDC001480]|uniref:AMP-binding protein n=1 Tax=Streptomyces sp. NPDC001480 TaxID=3364577 RepID=UPI0036BC464B